MFLIVRCRPNYWPRVVRVIVSRCMCRPTLSFHARLSVLSNLSITGKNRFRPTGGQLWKKSGFNITDFVSNSVNNSSCDKSLSCILL